MFTNISQDVENEMMVKFTPLGFRGEHARDKPDAVKVECFDQRAPDLVDLWAHQLPRAACFWPAVPVVIGLGYQSKGANGTCNDAGRRGIARRSIACAHVAARGAAGARAAASAGLLYRIFPARSLYVLLQGLHCCSCGRHVARF